MHRFIMPNRRLGKRAPRLSHRTLKLARYRTDALVPPPTADWITGVPSWPVMYNNVLGDCVIAGFGHAIEAWTHAVNPAGTVIVPDSDVQAAYSAIGGYVMGDPSTDQGCDMLTACDYWKATGLSGHKIAAYVSVDPTSLTEIKIAIGLFGCLYAGFALPLSAQEQNEFGKVWDVPSGGAVDDGSPGSLGGHCVPLEAYDADTFTCITWGETQKMTPDFISAYMDEAYVLLSPDWLNAQQVAPSSFNMAQLQADLATLT